MRSIQAGECINLGLSMIVLTLLLLTSKLCHMSSCIRTSTTEGARQPRVDGIQRLDAAHASACCQGGSAELSSLGN